MVGGGQRKKRITRGQKKSENKKNGRVNCFVNCSPGHNKTIDIGIAYFFARKKKEEEKGCS